MNVADVKQQISEAGRSAYSCGMVSAAGGNISMRLGDRFFVTATNAPLRDLHPEDILEVNADGDIVGEDFGGKRPSKEVFLHLAILRNRPDVDSVIHVHPSFSITSTLTFGREMPVLTVSAQKKLGPIGFVPYANPGSRELMESVEKCVKEGGKDLHVIHMEAHGILVFDQGMEVCYERTELAEDTAKVAVYTTLLQAALKKQQ